MSSKRREPLVSTIKELCRMCYTCVRECPAKAIRIVGGQAEVIADRCIGCGNCVQVCSRKAKRVLDSIAAVEALLASGERVAAIVAPSFPAEFDRWDPRGLVGMLRALGFASVHEVAYGADLVAAEYSRLLAENPGRHFIGTSCPALVNYVAKYHPGLLPFLAPIVSPMVAEARALKALHGEALRIVFIGPCIAKKSEAADPDISGEVDEALTFAELRELFARRRLAVEHAVPAEFDPPFPGEGMLYPVSRGSLQAARFDQDIIAGQVLAADGRRNFVEALKEIRFLEAHLLEILCCNGCIMGPGMTSQAPLFRRVAQVRRHVRLRLSGLGPAPSEHMRLGLQRRFRADDQRLPPPSEEEIARILRRAGKESPEDELNCGACGYETCREHAVAIHKGMAESEMCLPHTIDRLKESVRELAESHHQLARAQDALMQSERLASMGQLAAGIAHEVNNPLGAVLLYSHILLDECPPGSELVQDLRTIVQEADRCKTIVSGLLDFARRNKVAVKHTDLAAFLDQCLRIFPRPPSIELEVRHQEGETGADFDPDQITQVLTNLVSNAIAAMPDGGTLRIESGGDEREVFFKVVDTGVGIPPANRKKIFEPFFTTKKMNRGTGLGLAVTYGIIKMHRGRIEVESNDDPAAGPTGSTFTVRLPRVHPGEEPA